MPTRIPLVTQPPADGKPYVQKDGAWVAQAGATTTADGLLSKTDKAALDNLVSGGASLNAWAIGNAYNAGQVVYTSGGLFAANSAIPANTAFAIAPNGANTWRPVNTGLWSGFDGTKEIDITSTNVTVQRSATNKLDITDTSFTAKVVNLDRLALSATDSVLRSGTGTNSQLALTGDTAANLTVNGIQKVKVSSTGDAEFGADGSNKAVFNTSNLNIQSRGTKVIEVAGTGNEYLYLQSNGTSSGKVNLGPNILQCQIGSTEKAKINSVESTLFYDSGDFVTVQNDLILMQAGGIEKFKVNATDSRLQFNTSNLIRVDNGNAVFTLGGNDRLYANPTKSAMLSPDVSSAIEVTNSTARIIVGGVDRVSVSGATSTTFQHSGQSLIQLTPTNVLMRMNSTNSLWIDANAATFTVNNASALSIAQNIVTLGGSLVTKGGITPNVGSSYGVGGASLRYTTYYSVNALDASSDETLKENIERLPDALLDAWGKHVHPKQFNWIDKGVDEKKHISFIAQHIIAAFDEAGLDWKEYAVVSGDGVKEKHGVVYQEAHIIEAAYQRRKIAQQDARLAVLEALVDK